MIYIVCQQKAPPELSEAGPVFINLNELEDVS